MIRGFRYTYFGVEEFFTDEFGNQIKDGKIEEEKETLGPVLETEDDEEEIEWI